MRREGGKVKMMQDPGDKWIGHIRAVVHGKKSLI
jgi:hypothetical protein